MIDPQAGMRIAHLLGRRKPALAAPAKKRASAPPPPSRPSTPPPPYKPQPRASTVAYSMPPEPKVTAAEREAAIAGAMAAMREGDAYLKLLARDDELAAFAEHWERVAAEVEGREPRTNVAHGPSQERREVSVEEILDAGRRAGVI